MPAFEIIQGSILDFTGDCIVNPANSHLMHSGGLARVIADAAAPLASYPTEDQAYAAEGLTDWRCDNGSTSIYRAWHADHAWTAEQSRHPLIPTGGAGWTSAGLLPYKGIVHAVGPVWGGGGYMEIDLLARAHSNAVRVAAEHGCTSIAFPAISCGIFGFPVEKAAPVAIRSTLSAAIFWPSVEHVAFYLTDDAHYEAFRNA